MGFRKGTGFTNINRILQANRGTKLGQTVAGGITGQTQKVQTGIQGAQQSFDEEAQKNRLDTPEAAAKRSQVLGRFDEANAQPDESKFAPSSGLTSQYDTQKAALTGQQSQLQAQNKAAQANLQKTIGASSNSALQNSIAAKQKQYSDLRMRQSMSGTVGGMNYNSQLKDLQSQIKADQQKLQAAQNTTPVYQNLLSAQKTAGAAQEAQLANQLSNLEASYGKMTEAEKQNWMQSERDKLVAQNLPSEQEMADFTKYRTGTYTGPTELQDVGSLISQAQQAESLGGLARSSGGRQELLRQFVGGRDYTSGQRKLDETILGQDEGANLGAAARGTRGTVSDVTQANRAAAGTAKEFVGRAKEFGDETQKQIQAIRNPLSDRINSQITDLQGKEASRGADFKTVQDILSGKDQRFGSLDKNARLGLALQSAANSGSLTQEQVSQLIGQGGLIQRAGELGLDTNALISERMKDVAAQGIDRYGAATSDQKARISALDKLMGKRGPDVEFGAPGQEYKAGQTGFDVNSLRDYIAKTEAERLQADPQYSQKLKAAGISPMDQILGGAGMVANSVTGPAALTGLATGQGAIMGSQLGAALAGGGATMGAAGAAPIALAAMLGTDALTKGDSTAQAAEGAVQMGSGVAGLASKADDSVLRGLLNTTVGGQLLSKSPAGKQINNLLSAYSDVKQKSLGSLTKEGMEAAGGLRDLTQTGRLDQAYAKLSGLNTLKNVGTNVGNELGSALSKVSSGFGAGKTGNWAPAELETVPGSGKLTGSFANKSSAEILKQMTDPKQIAAVKTRTNDSDGLRVMNELMSYYQNAVKREQAYNKTLDNFYNQGTKISDENLKTDIDYSDTDVQSFMDRLKPASYDYKEEVKHDPRASEDRQIGVMAQDLEKSKLGKEAVHEGDVGKVVDYKDLEPKMLASLAALNQRLKKLEGKE